MSTEPETANKLMMKTCSDCKEVKPTSEFGRKKGNTDGLRGQCRSCRGIYDNMFHEQNGCCASCGEPPKGTGRTGTLQVDHCHSTGKVRALLCHGCNTAIGLWNEDIEKILSAARYLETYGT